jgi:hypothetical protein
VSIAACFPAPQSRKWTHRHRNPIAMLHAGLHSSEFAVPFEAHSRHSGESLMRAVNGYSGRPSTIVGAQAK